MKSLRGFQACVRALVHRVKEAIVTLPFVLSYGMTVYSNSEYADKHLALVEAGGNAADAVRVYVELFPNKRLPSLPSTFLVMDRRLRETGSFHADVRVGGYLIYSGMADWNRYWI